MLCVDILLNWYKDRTNWLFRQDNIIEMLEMKKYVIICQMDQLVAVILKCRRVLKLPIAPVMIYT